MRKAIARLARVLSVGGLVACAACSTGVSTGAVAADEAVVAAEIATCQAQARAADAGDNLHAYDVCMSQFGLQDGGAQ